MSGDQRRSREDKPPVTDRVSAGAVLARLDELELRIERLVSGGVGLGRFEGIPIFVARSVPGDHLRVRLTERRPDYGRAEIVEVLSPGTDRREPPCPHFELCGGCDLQQIVDERQAALKAAATLETLRRLGGIELPADTEVLAAEPWGYRLRTQLHSETDGEGNVRWGYYQRGSHRLVPVTSCPVCRPEIEAVLPRLPTRAAGAVPKRIDLAAGDGGRVTSAPVLEPLPHGEVRIDLEGLSLAFDARCFFQIHRGLLERLVDRVVGPWTGQTAYDLYGGVGLFAVASARRYSEVVLVESDRVAARYARINARRNRARNVEVVSRAVESWIGDLPASCDRVIVDPPRAGLSRRVRQALVECRPRRLTYVSCHAAAMARDLRELSAGYQVVGAAMLDLFPQTGHMEAVLQLKRLESA